MGRISQGQLLGQVVVYILAAIVFVLILGYGYRAITGFQEKAKQVALVDFKSELENAITGISRDYGSVRTINFILPEGFTGLCIVDSQDSGMLQASHPLLYNAWRGGAENIFLLPISMQSIPLKADNIEVFGKDGVRGFLCFEDARNVRLRFEGLGDGAKITLASAQELTGRLIWNPAGLVVSCPASCAVRQIVSTTLSSIPGCSEISSYGSRKTFCCCQTYADPVKQIQLQQQSYRRQLKAQRTETAQYLESGKQKGKCMLPCRTLPIPRQTQPSFYPELCVRRKLSPRNFWLVKAGELCCCPS